MSKSQMVRLISATAWGGALLDRASYLREEGPGVLPWPQISTPPRDPERLAKAEAKRARKAAKKAAERAKGTP